MTNFNIPIPNVGPNPFHDSDTPLERSAIETNIALGPSPNASKQSPKHSTTPPRRPLGLGVARIDRKIIGCRL